MIIIGIGLPSCQMLQPDKDDKQSDLKKSPCACGEIYNRKAGSHA